MKSIMSPSNIALLTLTSSLSLLGCESSDGAQPQAAVDNAPPQSEPVLANNEAPKAEAKPAVQEANADEQDPASQPSDQAAEDDEPSPAKQIDDAVDKADSKATKKKIAEDDGDKDEVDLKAVLTLKRLLVGTGVSGREPTGVARSFTKGKRIFAFVEVRNPEQVASEIFVSFFKDGTAPGRGIRVNVGQGARWRTWVATRRAKTVGKWHAIVRDGQRQEIGRTSFEIKPGSEPSDKDAKKAVKKDKPSAAGKDVKATAKAEKASKAKSAKSEPAKSEPAKSPEVTGKSTPPATKKVASK